MDDRDIRPLPVAARRGVVYPTLIWSGFGAAFICVVIGNKLQRELGTIDAILALLIGVWLLFVYSAAIGFACGRWGLNATHMLREAFGSRGSALPTLLLAFLVSGWFVMQLDLTTAILMRAIGVETATARLVVMACLAVLFTIPVAAGTQHGFAVTATALPAMVVFAFLTSGFIIDRLPSLVEGPLIGRVSFEAGVAIAFGTFAVSGTLTGDIVRFARTGDEAVTATAIAFLLTNLPFMIFGALLAAAGVDVLDLFTEETSGGLVATLCMLAVLSSWASCDACLANASLGLRTLLPQLPEMPTTVAIATAATVVAAGGFLGDLLRWIIWLSVLVPPVGAVLIADYYVVRNQAGFRAVRRSSVNVAAILAMTAGIAVGVAGLQDPFDISFPTAVAVVAAIVYMALAWLAPDALGAGLSYGRSSAEAID